MNKNIMIIYLIYLAVISVIAFIAYFVDKKKAENKIYRTKEAVLLTLSLIGGCFLSYPAMFIFHHKTKKWYFHLVNILGIFIHILVFLFMLRSIKL